MIQRFLRRRLVARARRRRAFSLREHIREVESGCDIPADFFSTAGARQAEKLQACMRALGVQLKAEIPTLERGRPARSTALLRRYRRAQARLADVLAEDRAYSEEYKRLRAQLSAVRDLPEKLRQHPQIAYPLSKASALLQDAHARASPRNALQEAQCLIERAKKEAKSSLAVLAAVKAESLLSQKEIAATPLVEPLSTLAQKLGLLLENAHERADAGATEAAGPLIQEATRLRGELAMRAAAAESRARQRVHEWREMATKFPRFGARFGGRLADVESVRGRGDFLLKWSVLDAEIRSSLLTVACAMGEKDQNAIAQWGGDLPRVRWGAVTSSRELIAFAERLCSDGG